MSKQFDSPRKRRIRQEWNLPLLEFLANDYGPKQLVYCGFPGKEALDIHEWIAHIKYVIAIQCRDPSKPTRESEDRSMIIRLRDVLNTLDREEMIEGFELYEGFLEEVTAEGRDFSSPQQLFKLQNFITLYNLDFCNKATEPHEWPDDNGVLRVAYKFQAIDKLLTFQKSNGGPGSKFVFFLTVLCAFDGPHFQEWQRQPRNATAKAYIRKCESLPKNLRNPRLVRLYVAQQIFQKFEEYGFVPTIFPTIRYVGDTQKAVLLHFTILGIEDGRAAHQNLGDILKEKFLIAEDDGIHLWDNVFDEEADVKITPIANFSDRTVFTDLWNAPHTLSRTKLQK